MQGEIAANDSDAGQAYRVMSWTVAYVWSETTVVQALILVDSLQRRNDRNPGTDIVILDAVSITSSHWTGRHTLAICESQGTSVARAWNRVVIAAIRVHTRLIAAANAPE